MEKVIPASFKFQPPKVSAIVVDHPTDAVNLKIQLKGVEKCSPSALTIVPIVTTHRCLTVNQKKWRFLSSEEKSPACGWKVCDTCTL